MTQEALLSGTTVLIVEDEPACRDAFSVILKHAGAGIAVAPDAEKGLALLGTSGFDVILADIRLPGMDGLSLLRKVKESHPEISVVIITGFGSLKTATEALKFEAQNYITKPLTDPSLLTGAVFRAAERSRLLKNNLALQAELRQSEEMFRTLFQNTADVVMLFPPDAGGTHGPIQEANMAARRKLNGGRPLPGKTRLLDLVPQTHVALVTDALQRCLNSGCASLETVFMSKDGTLVPVDVTFHRITLHNRHWIICTAHDMTSLLAMERKAASAADEEARKLGSEMHDVLCQDLVSIDLIASSLAKNGRTRRATDIRLISDLSSQALNKAREMARGIFPVALETDSLEDALQELAARMSRLHGIKVKLDMHRNLEPPDKSVRLHIYRIIQEAIRNAATGGRAHSVSVSLRKSRRCRILTVEDNGNGFSHGNEANCGIGMSIMQHRAKLIGAALRISSRKKGGTILECVWQ